MKILMLNYEFPPIGGGASTATFYILKEFAKRNNLEIDLVTSSAGKHEEIKQSDNVNIHRLDIGKNGELQNQSLKDLLVYSWKAWKFSKKLKKKNDYDLVHAFFGIPCGFLAMKLGLPYVVSLRGSDVPFYSEKYKLLDALFFQRMSRKIWKRANSVVANSEGLKRLALETDPKQKISVICNGVDTGVYRPREKEDKEFTVISTSRVTKRKGIEYLVDGFIEFRKKHGVGKLLIIGDGDQKEELVKRATNAGAASYIKFEGMLLREEVRDRYKKADVFVLPSLNEGMSNSLLESLASGLAIIATDTGGTKELVDESNGIIVGMKSSEDIFKALEMLHADRRLLDSMKKRSRERALGMSWETVAKQYLGAYNKNKVQS